MIEVVKVNVLQLLHARFNIRGIAISMIK